MMNELEQTDVWRSLVDKKNKELRHLKEELEGARRDLLELEVVRGERVGVFELFLLSRLNWVEANPITAAVVFVLLFCLVARLSLSL